MARLSHRVRRRIIVKFPPVRCHATANSTGKPCQKYAMVGTTICCKHGGMAKQVRRKAMERIAIAEAELDLKAVEPRQPWEVLTTALHVNDMVMRQAMLKAGQDMSASELTDLINATVRAHHMAKVNHEAGTDERRVQLQERQAAQMQAVFVRVLNGLDLTAAQRALVPHLLQREIAALTPRVLEAA